MDMAIRILRARHVLNLSQYQVAKYIAEYGDKKEVARTTVAQWESGKTKTIEAANLLKLARVLNRSPEWLVFGEDDLKSSYRIPDKGLLNMHKWVLKKIKECKIKNKNNLAECFDEEEHCYHKTLNQINVLLNT